MGLWSFLKRLLLGLPAGQQGGQRVNSRRHRKSPRASPVLSPFRFRQKAYKIPPKAPESSTPPYRFAWRNPATGKYQDLSRDTQPELLQLWKLPELRTVDDLADWLEMPLGKVAWLTGKISSRGAPSTIEQSHYSYRWLKKKKGGERLIEAPKPILKTVQRKILSEILDRVPLHSACHSFTFGRSILTNARPHVGQRVVLKFDLQNFYASVSFSRVTAIFRGLGYSREVALWLARLTTTAVPAQMPFPDSGPAGLLPYSSRHLPQGAPGSPALANLSAYSLDLRLAGLAKSFGANYTRYADDLTFSGPQRLISGLRILIPLTEKVIRQERFSVHVQKRKVLRNNQRQTVTGVVVNEHPNISRRDYDELKAILHNCVRHGPQSQNRENRDNFREYLQGKIAHVAQLNPARGEKLSAQFQQIRW